MPMDRDAIFAAAARNRLAMADLLEPLTPEQLAHPSLCGDWDVQTVGAHLATAITTNTRVFLVEVIRQRGNFDKANAATSHKEARNGITATIAKIRANADSRFVPPIAGPRAPLTDVIVHTGDIARPLGLTHTAPDEDVRTALEFLTAGKPIAFVGRGWLTDLRLVANDVDFSFGSGAELHGRGIDLMMALCGRGDALRDLTGDGAVVLARRLA
jgi:uncharacterized protein (TIGR03083 family)